MKKKSQIGIVLVVIVILVFVFTKTFSQSQPRHYTVKLYSAERIVGTWEALDFGKADGQTLEFTVGNRSFPTRVKINGTFSVEEHD